MAKLLLIEDDKLISKMLSLRLRRRSHEITCAYDGQEGCSKALDGQYDAILMDMHMPVMDGHEAVERLRNEGYGGLIIAVTASVMAEETESAIKSGCNYFIPKPVTDDFEEQVEKFIGEFGGQ